MLLSPSSELLNDSMQSLNLIMGVYTKWKKIILNNHLKFPTLKI